MFSRRAFFCVHVCTSSALHKEEEDEEEMLDNNKFPGRSISHQIFVSSLHDDGKHEMSRQLKVETTRNPKPPALHTTYQKEEAEEEEEEETCY